MTNKSAKGLTGILIRTDDGYYFRAYNGYTLETFTDYKLLHSDLAITITDPDAFLYTKDDEHYLDHSPSTLGNK